MDSLSGLLKLRVLRSIGMQCSRLTLDLWLNSTLIDSIPEHLPFCVKTGTQFFSLNEPMSEYYREKPVKLGDGPENTENEFFGDACSVRHIEGEYFFSYISGELAGRHKEFSISVTEYHAFRAGNINRDDILQKYGAH